MPHLIHINLLRPTPNGFLLCQLPSFTSILSHSISIVSSDKLTIENLEKALSDTSIVADALTDTAKKSTGAATNHSKLTTAQILEQKFQEVVEEEHQPLFSSTEEVSDFWENLCDFFE